jgi:antitoxin ParD1/3/4
LHKLPFFGNFEIKYFAMGKNTSISLGDHFEDFIESAISKGRFNNASEVVRAGLRLLEDEEHKIIALKKAIQEGIDSGIAEDFEAKAFLESLKARKNNG